MPIVHTRVDPFREHLLKPISFVDDVQHEEYMQQLTEALSWVHDVDYCLVVADAMLPDFPIVAVSDGFVAESKYSREDMIQTNCRHLLERVSGDDVYRISRSARSELRAFCQISRFPGAVNSGCTNSSEQPNMLGDGSCVSNCFVVFRVYVSGHPLLVGLQNFLKFNDDFSDESRIKEEEFEVALKDRIIALSQKLCQHDGLRKLFAGCTEVRSELPEDSDNADRLGDGLYCGDKAPGNLLFFDGGHGVLRLEPHELPYSNVIFTAKPVAANSEGVRRLSLRVETTVNQYWQSSAGPLMGFSRRSPESTHRLHFLGQMMGFTLLGPAVNKSEESLLGIGDWKKHLTIFPMEEFPDPVPGDIVTVELASNGELRRYSNGKLLHTVETRIPPDDGEWFGVFEVSFGVARATLVGDDAYFDTSQSIGGSDSQSQLDAKDAKDVEDIFNAILNDVEHLSMTIASTKDDNPLVAVSDGFVTLTGFKREDIIGRNCRFLNTGSSMTTDDRAGIRRAIRTGAPYCSLLPNTRADGTQFDNLLDLRTLELGVDETGKPVRFLVGIQGEVSEIRPMQQWLSELPSLRDALKQNVTRNLHKMLVDFWIRSENAELKPHPTAIWLDSTDQHTRRPSLGSGYVSIASS